MPESHSKMRVGIWAEWPSGYKWANEGMTRLVGFLIEGAAASGKVCFTLVIPAQMRAAAHEDLASIAAVEDRDFILRSPEEQGEGDDLDALVDFANQKVEVDGWLILFPHFSRGVRLDGRKATIFPDAIPRLFPHFADGAWEDSGVHREIMERVAATLLASDMLITFSNHVALNQAVGLFGYPKNNISVVPHALPDLENDIPFAKGRLRTPATRLAAAQLLRDHAKRRSWRYLQDFPFEEVDYIVVSTQDRASKNISAIAQVVCNLIRLKRRNIKLITTASIHFGASWTLLPGLIEHEQIQLDLLSMSDLPRDVHAALYHAAALAVHSSFFEGGRAPFPFSEALSVGTPCIMARGPHVAELLRDAPALAVDTFDPYSMHELQALVERTLDARENVLERQTPIFEMLARKRTWSIVAEEYAMAALGRPIIDSATW